jgi:hypothetical protein
MKRSEREARAGMEAEEKSAKPRRGLRESLYSHIHVSVRTMNIIIGVIAFLLVVSIIIGVAQGGR